MRSNIRYIHPQTSIELRRYEERIEYLEAINESLLDNNEKLGQHIKELNSCHQEKARIMGLTIQSLERQLGMMEDKLNKEKAEQLTAEGQLRKELEQLRVENDILNGKNKYLFYDLYKAKRAKLSTEAELTKLREEQQCQLLQHYESRFYIDYLVISLKKTEEEKATLASRVNYIEDELRCLHYQLKYLKSTDLYEVSIASDTLQDNCKVLTDIMNIRMVTTSSIVKRNNH